VVTKIKAYKENQEACFNLQIKRSHFKTNFNGKDLFGNQENPLKR
jgi:hypothetical protein